MTRWRPTWPPLSDTQRRYWNIAVLDKSATPAETSEELTFHVPAEEGQTPIGVLLDRWYDLRASAFDGVFGVRCWWAALPAADYLLADPS